MSGYGSYYHRKIAQPITSFDVMDMATRCFNLINFQWKKQVEYEGFASTVSIDLRSHPSIFLSPPCTNDSMRGQLKFKKSLSLDSLRSNTAILPETGW